VSRTACQDAMSSLCLLVLLALIALAIAALPVLVGSVKEDRSVDEVGPHTIHLTARGPDRWHARLRRRNRQTVDEPAPDTESTMASGRQR